MPTPIPSYDFTPEKLAQIKTQKDALVENRVAAVEELSQARAMGDLSENGRYKSARQNLSGIDSTIRRLSHWIQFAKVIKKPTSTTIVSMGSTVTITSDGYNRTFTIVGKLESDPNQGKISNRSPIGSAMLGKRVGDTIQVNTPKQMVKMSIVSIT